MDFAMPLDLVDPGSGMDYFTAADMLETQLYAGRIPTAAVRQDPLLGKSVPRCRRSRSRSATERPGYTATQNIFNHFATNPLNASYGIYSMDMLCNPGCGGRTTAITPASTAVCPPCPPSEPPATIPAS